MDGVAVSAFADNGAAVQVEVLCRSGGGFVEYPARTRRSDILVRHGADTWCPFTTQPTPNPQHLCRGGGRVASPPQAISVAGGERPAHRGEQPAPMLTHRSYPTR